MKKVSFVSNELYQKNIIFDKNQTKLKIGNFDKYHALYNEFRKYGYLLATDDIHTREKSDIILYFDMPKSKMPLEKEITRSYLLAMESSIIRPDNFEKEKHNYFNKIFTWSDKLVDNKKYIKFNYSFNLPKRIDKNIEKEKFCCLIVGNKTSNFPNELYSERKNLIKWFEKNHLDEFDLYGFGWDNLMFNRVRLIRALNKIPLIKKIIFSFFGEKRPSYQGTIENKLEVMKKYKFAIAYENVKDESGYITEKIFDAFFSSCVPIYWGADNITEYIPKECFIDKRDFQSNKALYDYLKSIDHIQYERYLENIEAYLNSKEAEIFDAKTFASTIVSNTIGKINENK